jgi:multidrug efflux pump subunit AcrA (membrane-fusion protein)
LIAAALGGVLRAEDNAKTQGTPCPKKVAVVLETVKTGVFMEYQYYAGQGHAEIVAVKSPVGGVLSEVKVSEGSLVDAGQDLAVLNAGMSEEIKKLEAAAAKAKKTLATRQGWKVKNEKAVQSAANDYQKALDQLNKAKAQSGMIVKAPVAGIAHLVMAAGSEIAADARLLEITNPLQMIFQIPLAAADKGSLAIGDKFVGTTEGFNGEVPAEVIAVSGTQVTFRVNNDGSQFREGVGFTFKKLKAEHADAIVVPSAAVQKDSLGEYIYLAEKKNARKMYVTIGASAEGKTMVEKGLGVGASIIVSGFDCLVDGKKIRIVNEEELAKEKQVTTPAVKAETPMMAEKPEVTKDKRFRVGLTFGRFEVNDKNLRAFYGDWFKNIPGIEVSAHIIYNVDIWASYKSFTEEQTTTYFKNPVKFKLVPLSVGLRYRFPQWRFLEPFVGAGLNFYSYKETIQGESALANTKGSATGFHFQGGTYFHANNIRFLLGEFFVKYNMVKKTLTELLPDGSDQLDLGGLEVGVGVVVRF